jgi:hypothetical protein
MLRENSRNSSGVWVSSSSTCSGDIVEWGSTAKRWSSRVEITSS